VYIATVPTAPTSLAAAASSITLAINLTWTDTAVTETAYDVDRSADGGTTWATLTSTLPANTQAYSDASVAPVTSYSYRVKATNGTVSSTYSNIASATSPNGPPPPLAPSGLAATVKGGGAGQKIVLSWKDNAANATSYVVDRSTNQVAWTRLTSSLSASATSYTDSKGIARQTRYYYRVGAINATNSSSPSYSNIASATTV
jgi:titin